MEKPENSKAKWKNFYPGWRNRESGPDIISDLGGEHDYISSADENYRVNSSRSGQPSGHIGVLDPASMTKVNKNDQ